MKWSRNRLPKLDNMGSRLTQLHPKITVTFRLQFLCLENEDNKSNLGHNPIETYTNNKYYYFYLDRLRTTVSVAEKLIIPSSNHPSDEEKGAALEVNHVSWGFQMT